MIKNERQYKITKAQAARFAETLRQFEGETSEVRDVHPLLLKAKQDALRSQLADLENDLREYEALKAGTFEFGQLLSVTELPKLLIRARIASGLSQRDLADRLGLKEQQIQRYEASDYSSASFARIKKVVTALGVDVDDSMLVDGGGISVQALISRVAKTGLSKDFVQKRLVPRQIWELTTAVEGESGATLVHETAENIGKIFRWTPKQLFGGEALELSSAINGVKFKVAANANPERVTAYTVYAHYLSLLVAQASQHIPVKAVPTDPYELREVVESNYGTISLGCVVNYIWDLGIPVLPLDDSGAFQGACFREDGRNVIVLKQKTKSESRWVFDVLHEVWHAGQEPELPERSVLELDEDEVGAGLWDEEITASRFAAAVLLRGRGQELAEKCLTLAGGDLTRLKSTVQKVAAEEGVPVDSLANYIASRLSTGQGRNWWAAANSLQVDGTPWDVVRNIFFERVDFTRLAEPERQLLSQALTPWMEVA